MSARCTIAELLQPSSVAIIGATDGEEKWGGRVMRHLITHGYSGRIAPVNPRRSEILGMPAYPSIAAIPDPVDVAAIVVPADAAVRAAEECAAAGVRAAVIISAQFAEAGPTGAARQAALARLARATGMRVLGPNCLGFINAPARLALSPSLSLASMTHLPRGGIGLVSQSGALMGSLMIRGFDLGAGFSACVSVGNQADLVLCDFLEHLIHDENTRVIGLYLEAAPDLERFGALAAEAQARRKLVLAAKAGRTPAGEPAVRAHTGSAAGSYAEFRAACRRHEVVLVDDALELLPVAETVVRQGRMSAAGVAIFSGSGGSAALWTDAVCEHGMRPAELQTGTREALAAFLPPAHCRLPVDLGTIGPDAPPYREAVERIMLLVMADPDVGAGLYILTTQPNSEDAARAAAAAAAGCGKPLLVVNAAGSSGEAARRVLRDRRVLSFDSGADAVRTLRALWAEQSMRAERRGRDPGARAGSD